MIFPNSIIKSRYRADKILGRGGMGEVWMCHDLSLDRPIVLKTVRPDFTSKSQDISIFVDEAKIGASLSGHPNVVTVFDIINEPSDTEPILAIAMEYVEGMSCSEWIENGPKLVIEDKTRYYMSLMVALETCKAISYAHRNSILHRDIKPLNIFISKYGITKIGDFGISRFTDELTREHTVWHFRSPAYSAPEQWNNEKPDIDTEIYQIGCTLYQLFTGELPFVAKSHAAMIQMHLTAVPVNPKTMNPLISDTLSSLILQCLEKEKSKRPALWQVIEAIAKEVQNRYEMYIKIDKDNLSLVNKVIEITEFVSTAFEADGSAATDFADFNEAISEAFELIMLPNVEIRLTPLGN